MALTTQHLSFYVLFLSDQLAKIESKKDSHVFSEPCISEIEHCEAIYSNDLTKIERKKTSVVFSEPCISEIENYEAIYSNDLTKRERKKKSVLTAMHL
jgi:hypothetical protein